MNSDVAIVCGEDTSVCRPWGHINILFSSIIIVNNDATEIFFSFQYCKNVL